MQEVLPNFAFNSFSILVSTHHFSHPSKLIDSSYHLIFLHLLSIKMSSAPKIILTTGSNRGIGFSIVQALSTRYPENTYILACRSTSSGHEAIKELKKLGVKAKLDVVELDIVNDDTIVAAAKYVEDTYGRLDGLLPLS